MCLICMELEKLTFPEAVNNFYEMHHDMDRDHIIDLVVKIADKAFSILEKDFEPKDHDLYVKKANQLLHIVSKLSEEDIDLISDKIVELPSFERFSIIS